MLDHLLRPTKYHDKFALLALKYNPYHDAQGEFTTKDKAAPAGPAQMLASQHTHVQSPGEILAKELPNRADRERFVRAAEEARRLHDSGRSTEKEHTRLGTKSYTNERLLLHQRIINKLLEHEEAALPAPGTRPKLIVLGGRSGSGKGGFGRKGPMQEYDPAKTIVLDPDTIKGMLPGYEPRLAPLYHAESVAIFNKVVAIARKRGLNVVLDFTLSHDATPLVRSFKKADYAIEAHYVHRPPDKAAASTIRRWQEPSHVTRLDGSVRIFSHGRIVPLDVVLGQTKNERQFDKLKRLADEWTLYDNSRDEYSPKKIDSSSNRHRVAKRNPYRDLFGRWTTKLKAVTGFGKGKKKAKKTKKPSGVEKFTQHERQEGRVLNGVEMRTNDDPDFSQSVNREIDEPPFQKVPGKHVAAGIVVTEPDGRVWIVQPKNMYGGYKNTFPKGTVKEGEDLQETAAREVWEESGLVVKITGHLVDVERGFSKTRFYRGERVGGAPWMAGRESHAVKLIPIEGKDTDKQLENVLGKKTTDQQVIDALRKTKKQDFVCILKKQQGNPFHDRLGQFTSKDKAVAAHEHSAQDALHSVLAGDKKVNIDRYDVREFLQRALKKQQKTGEEANLSQLYVEGMKIFGSHGLGIKRKNMPQIPREHRRQFLQELEDAGVKIVEEHVDPLTLKITQKEISAANVAAKLDKYEAGGKEFPPLLVSKEDHVLDGHHHWGMMAAFAIDHPDAKVPIFRIMLKTRKALAVMHAYDRKHWIKREALGGEAQKYEWVLKKNPYHDKEGEFTTKEKAVEPLWEKKFVEHWKAGGGTLYHGTSSAAIAAIKAEGLKPAGGKGADSTLNEELAQKFMVGDRKASVFLMQQDDYAKAQKEALYYAKLAAKANPGSEPVLLIIRLPKRLVKQLKTDEENNVELARRLKVDRIPPEWIKVVKKAGTIGTQEELVSLRDEMTWMIGIMLCKEQAEKRDFVWVLKKNPYRDKEGQYTTKERAVAPGWYKSHGGHHVEVGAGGKIVSGAHAGKTAKATLFAAGPFKTHAEAKAHALGGLKPATSPTTTHEKPVKAQTKPKVTPLTVGQLEKPTGTLGDRSDKIEALLKAGTAPQHAILQVKQSAEANASRVKAIGSGPALHRAVQEYSETPTQDLDVLTGIHVEDKAVQGQANCSWARKVTMGSTSVTGDFRHELGHAIHMSLSPALQQHVIALHEEAMAKAKAKKNPAGMKKKLSHEFYQHTYGVVGRRAMDNWHEDFAEHYRAYVKAVHQVKHGKDPQALARYTQMFPKWSKFWDAYYAGGAS